MALTSTTTFDVINVTSTITFNNPSQVDQITFSGNQITFQTCSSYTLVKSDFLLYFKYLNSFNNQLFINFPSISQSINSAFPLSVFDITIYSAGVTHIIYNQTSLGTTVTNINYVPIAGAAAIVARSSPVTITLQEFFMFVYILNQYSTQILVN